MSAPERVDIEISGKPYNISTTSIPYFASYISFQRQSEQAADKHGRPASLVRLLLSYKRESDAARGVVS